MISAQQQSLTIRLGIIGELTRMTYGTRATTYGLRDADSRRLQPRRRMTLLFTTPFAIAALAAGCGRTERLQSARIEQILQTQAESWNEGDIDAFMTHYLNSPNLTFSSGGKTTRGWQQTLERYKSRYPTAEDMGQLTFSHLEITPLCSRAALVLGRWHLERESEPIGGNFSLVFRRIAGRWVIAHDHTSVDPDL